MDMVTSVVIVGSGFTGFECARRLARRLRKTDVDITIISPVDYMLYTPLLPDVAGGVVDARFVAIPLAGTPARGARDPRPGGQRRLGGSTGCSSPTSNSAPASCPGTGWC